MRTAGGFIGFGGLFTDLPEELGYDHGAPAWFYVVVLGIAYSRIYLNAHWFSDVLGGLSGGAAYLALGISWLERGRAEGDDGE